MKIAVLFALVLLAGCAPLSPTQIASEIQACDELDKLIEVELAPVVTKYDVRCVRIN